MPTNGLVLFESKDKNISLNVPLRNDSVWLNRSQMAELFDRDVKTIGKHVNNAVREELDRLPVIAKFATTAADGKTYIDDKKSIDDYILVALTSMIAQSQPEEKEMMISVIMNWLNSGQ